jgi:hypothetical protein
MGRLNRNDNGLQFSLGNRAGADGARLLKRTRAVPPHRGHRLQADAHFPVFKPAQVCIVEAEPASKLAESQIPEFKPESS